jgi:uracil-DNA glycosylase
VPAGFFHPLQWQKQKVPLSLVPQCEACGLYKQCESGKMAVSGKGRRNVLLVGEAPGENEDRLGRPFVGAAGAELTRLLANIGVDMRQDCFLTNAVICRPQTAHGENRTPTSAEMDFCRPNLTKTLFSLQPDVVILLGGVAIKSLISLAWKEGEVDHTQVARWAGWQIPCQKLNAWICPTYHPSFLLHKKNPAAELHVLNHLRSAFSHKSKPWKTLPDYRSKLRVIMDDREAAEEIHKFEKSEMIAFDYETTTLKPDGRHARILCCSISDGERSISYPWTGQAVGATRDVLRASVPKIASNIRFEERWTRKEFGFGVRNWKWDTVLGAHWRNCRRGVCGLKFQAFVLLGMPDYSSHLDSYMKSKSGNSNSRNRLHKVEPFELMLYCAYDSLLEVLVARKQMEGT